MSGDLPLVETHFPVIVMKYPTKKFQQQQLNIQSKATVPRHLCTMLQCFRYIAQHLKKPNVLTCFVISNACMKFMHKVMGVAAIIY
eukprot:3424588-Ditylum_brightwellii.AAC.1